MAYGESIQFDTWLLDPARPNASMAVWEAEEELELFIEGHEIWCRCVKPDRKGRHIILGRLNDYSKNRVFPMLTGKARPRVDLLLVDEERGGVEISIYIEARDVVRAYSIRKHKRAKAESERHAMQLAEQEQAKAEAEQKRLKRERRAVRRAACYRAAKVGVIRCIKLTAKVAAAATRGTVRGVRDYWAWVVSWTNR